MRIIFLICLLIPPLNAWAKTADSIPLQFQANKNNIQILPQRFEYNLVDEDQIKIGDIVINSTTFGFQISPKAESNGKFRARFVWPAGLLKDGMLSVRDNTGKTIWSTAVSRKNTRPLAPRDGKSVAEKSSPLVRNQLTEFITDQFEAGLVEDMKYFPFMSVCINRTTQDTNIYLCSKELYFETQGKRGVRSRAQGRRQAFVEINGKSVGNQGIIFLNDENENISFRAMTQSGAILEVETRMKPVDFKDVVLSEDKKNLILTASGAEPVNEDQVKRISEDEWQYQVSAVRPLLYLKGAGEIPMRQEFNVTGRIPGENLRPFVEPKSPRRVYKPRLHLAVETPPGTKALTGAPAQQIEKIDDNHVLWTIDEIPTGQTSRHYLRVSDGDGAFTAAYDIYRDFAFEGGALVSYWEPAGQLYGSFFISWWIENFLGIETWERLRWGLRAEQTFNIIQKNSELNLTLTRLELIWREQAGFHFVDPTWGLILPFEILQATGLNTSSLGIGAFYSDRTPRRWRHWMRWYDAKFVYLFGGSGAISLKNALQLQLLAYYPANPRLSWNYGVGLSQYSFDPSQSKMQVQLLGGATYRF